AWEGRFPGTQEGTREPSNPPIYLVDTVSQSTYTIQTLSPYVGREITCRRGSPFAEPQRSSTQSFILGTLWRGHSPGRHCHQSRRTVPLPAGAPAQPPARVVCHRDLVAQVGCGHAASVAQADGRRVRCEPPAAAYVPAPPGRGRL